MGYERTILLCSRVTDKSHWLPKHRFIKNIFLHGTDGRLSHEQEILFDFLRPAYLFRVIVEFRIELIRKLQRLYKFIAAKLAFPCAPVYIFIHIHHNIVHQNGTLRGIFINLCTLRKFFCKFHHLTQSNAPSIPYLGFFRQYCIYIESGRQCIKFPIHFKSL